MFKQQNWRLSGAIVLCLVVLTGALFAFESESLTSQDQPSFITSSSNSEKRTLRGTHQSLRRTLVLEGEMGGTVEICYASWPRGFVVRCPEPEVNLESVSMKVI